MSKLRGLVSIIRPVNAAMMGFSILVGILISGRLDNVALPTLLFSFIVGFTLTGAAMVINDYFDRAIDEINEPHRPIPSGSVKPGEALIFCGFLSLIGLGTAWATGVNTLIIALFAWSIMMLYSAWGKRTGLLGNLMVSVCIAIPFLYGGVLSGRLDSTLIFSSLAFLTNTGREITKGIIDVEGDSTENVKTIAVVHGARVAAFSASFFYITSVLLSSIPIILNLVSILYIPFVIVTDIGLVYASLDLLRNQDRVNARKVKNQVMYWMLSGLLAFGAGTIKF